MSKSTLETPAIHRHICHFTGRVQGVGFRFTARNIAMRHNVTGYVRNLPDGRVELVMEGPDEEIQSVIDAVTERMSGYIHHVDRQDAPTTGEFAYFFIRHC